MAPGELTHWRERARCQGGGKSTVDLFYSDDKENVERAKKICDACDVWKPCLRYAIENGEKHGTWGGRSAKEREKLAVFREAIVSGVVYHANAPVPEMVAAPSVFSFTDAFVALRFTFASSLVYEQPSMPA